VVVPPPSCDRRNPPSLAPSPVVGPAVRDARSKPVPIGILRVTAGVA